MFKQSLLTISFPGDVDMELEDSNGAQLGPLVLSLRVWTWSLGHPTLSTGLK